jgi:hypothetical protein
MGFTYTDHHRHSKSLLLASMLRCIQRYREQNFAQGVSDFQVPSAPVDLVCFAFLAQFLDRLDGLIMRCFQIRDFNARLIEDPFMPVHEMKETMHSKAALAKLFNHRTYATPEPTPK